MQIINAINDTVGTCMSRQNQAVLDEQEIIQYAEHPLTAVGGRSSEADELLDPTTPVMTSDRPGKATIHGPGQSVIWFTLNLDRRDMKYREFAELVRSVVVEQIRLTGLPAEYKNTPVDGIYVEGRKIANTGIKRKGPWVTYGFSVNVDCDLEMYNRIKLCGCDDIEVTSIAAEGVSGHTAETFGFDLATRLVSEFDLWLSRNENLE